MVSSKAFLRGTFIATQAYLKNRTKRYWTDDLTWYLKQLDKAEEQQKQRGKNSNKKKILA